MEFDLIKEEVDRLGLRLASPILWNPSAENSAYIPLFTNKSESGTRVPSHKTLADLKKVLQLQGISAAFLLIDPSSRMLEEGVRASLISTYPNLVRNSFLNIDASTHHIWIDTKTDPAEHVTLIKDHITAYLQMFQISRYQVHFIGDTQLATNTEILAIIRRKSPIGCEELKLELESRAFPVPSLDWINRKFDALRRSGLLVRRKDRTYALTAEALHRLGTRKDRFSPDLARLLDLARRGA